MPVEQDPVPFAFPSIGAEEEEAVLGALRSGWLTTGAQALAFEKEFGEFLKGGPVRFDSQPLYCLAVNSATSGLHLAAEACGVKPGDLVLVPSCTFTSTAEVLRYLGADPVFVDSIPDGFHIDPQALEETIRRLLDGKNPYTGKAGYGGKPVAVMPVHYGGLACDMGAIMDIARRYNLKVIEDAAHSFPSPTPDGYAGTIGDAGVFSFYATKTITTGEGGMVVCKDEAMAKRISVMRSHGIDRSVWNRYTDTKASWYYEVIEAGCKYNLPDLLAALGRAQLRRANELLQKRQAIAARYDGAFSHNEHFLIPQSAAGDARHLYPLRLNLHKLGISRDDFIVKLQENGIGVSVHFIPLHTMPFY
jgi:dTDP-4-amino-4,6-dideoxygalactose transaminase